MQSSCQAAELKQPLLDREQVDLEASVVVAAKNKHELDVEHHVSSSSVATDVDNETEDAFSSNIDGLILWVGLPTLLFSQFGMAFMMHDESTATLSWTIVNLSIILWVVTTWLFRHACNDSKIKTIFILLMPEILMDVVLGLVLFNRVALGFMVLLVSMLCLSSFVVVSTAAFLYFGKRDEQEEEKVEAEPVKQLTACRVV